MSNEIDMLDLPYPDVLQDDSPEESGEHRSFPKTGELWSLWDLMKTIQVSGLVYACNALAAAQDAYCDDEFLSGGEEHNLNEKGKTRVRRAFEALHAVCENLHLRDLAATFKAASTKVPNELETFYFATEQFEEAMKRRWLFLPARDAWTYYNRPALFGEDVNNAFPSSAAEIKDAGNCLILQQPTAAVFHLMRALEAPMIALGREFGLTDEMRNWNTYLNDIEKAFRDRSPEAVKPADWATSRDYFADTTAYLFSVKNAWRNYTQHLKARYTDEEAREILEAVKSFMKRAAKRLRERQ